MAADIAVMLKLGAWLTAPPTRTDADMTEENFILAFVKENSGREGWTCTFVGSQTAHMQRGNTGLVQTIALQEQLRLNAKDLPRLSDGSSERHQCYV